MAKPSGESKAPLVIALVFFILTTLALGVFYYMAQDKIAAAQAEAKKANDESGTARKELAKAKEQTLVYKVAVGVNTPEEFESLKNALNEADARATHAALMAEVKNKLVGTPQVPGLVTNEAKAFIGKGERFDVAAQDVLKWDWAEGAKLEKEPERSLLFAVVNSYARRQLAGLQLVAERRELQTAKEAYEAAEKLAKAAETNYKAQAAAYPVEIKKATDNFDKQVGDVQTGYKTNIKEHNKKVEELTTANTTKDIELQEKEGKLKGQAAQLKRAEEKEQATMDPFSFDKPHGRIESKRGNMLTINLGSADNVRAGLTFSVQPQDTPERGLQSRARPRIGGDGKQVVVDGRPVVDIVAKGTIEVVTVLGPNSSEARITSNPDPVRDAIIPGDALYNAAWRKGGADHVALFGVFDINADGSDDIKQVVRDLAGMGVIVDAYFDLETKKWVGKVTEQTAYAVEGNYPATTIGTDALAGAKAALDQALRDAKQLAKDKGVAVVKARTFFARIGYRIRTDITNETINRAYNKYLQATPIETGEPK